MKTETASDAPTEELPITEAHAAQPDGVFVNGVAVEQFPEKKEVSDTDG
jgi:hypothetical protein